MRAVIAGIRKTVLISIKFVGCPFARVTYVADVILRAPHTGRMLSVENAARIQIAVVDTYGTGEYFTAERHGLVPLPVRFQCRTERAVL